MAFLCCPPGPGCSMCCLLWSTWGVIMLIFIGAGFEAGYDKIDNGALKDHHGAASASFIAAVIYFLFVVGCGSRWFYLYRASGKQEKFSFEDVLDGE